MNWNRLRTICRIVALLNVAWVSTAMAQGQALGPARDIFHESLQRDGNQISFCYDPRGMLADFHLDLAAAIGDALLTEVTTVPLPPRLGIEPPPYDYRLPLLPDHIFVLLAERCVGLLGYALSPRLPEWLMVTRAYMSAPMLLVTRDAGFNRLEDLPVDQPIGTRSMSTADNRLINFIQARPAEERWRRFPYFSNDVVLDKLADGTIGMGLVWEPALYYLTDGDPEAEGIRILPQMPFASEPVELGIGIRTQDTYLNTMLGQAIAALEADGTIAALLAEHKLSRPLDEQGAGTR